MNNAYSMQQAVPVAKLDVGTRATFIARTYIHLVLALFGFTFLEIYFFSTEWAGKIFSVVGQNWLLALGGFILVSWLARGIAHKTTSKPLQYAALAGFVLAEAIIFVPLLAYAQAVSEGGVIESAAVVTLTGFLGLTIVAFYTRKDFSFLRGILFWGGIVALLLILGGSLFGFQLGMFFSVAMVALAGGSILYDTSNIIHRYSEDRYVAASLELFASVALMFWYVLQIFLSSRD